MGETNEKQQSVRQNEQRKNEESMKVSNKFQFTESLNTLKNLLNSNPSNALHEKMGEILNSIGLFKEAKQHFEKVLQANPINKCQILRKLACIEAKVKDFKKSSQLLKKASEINSNELQTLNLMIVNYSQMGLFKEAEQIIKLSLKKIYQNQISFKGKNSMEDIALANFYNNTANTYRYLGNYQQSIQLYEKAIKLNDENSLFYVNCATSLSQQSIGNYKKAYQYLEKAENLMLEQKVIFNSHVYNEIQAFKNQIQEWNFKRKHNFSTEEQKKMFRIRMKNLEEKISNLYETDLDDKNYNYGNTVELDNKLEIISKQIHKNQLNLQCIHRVDKQIFALYEENQENFGIIPFFFVLSSAKCLKTSKKLSQIEDEVNKSVVALSEKYPPSTFTQNTKANYKIKSFCLPQQSQPNLFQNKYFKSYENLMNEILSISKKAEKVFPQFDDFLRNICLTKGFKYKSGLKFTKGINQILEAKIIIRIAEKLFKNLKDKKTELLEKVEAELKSNQNWGMKTLTKGYLQEWKKIISNILMQKIEKKEETVCRIYDFIRAKCMFHTVEQLEEVGQNLLQKCQQKGLKVIECENRLNKHTKDLVFKINFGQIVGEIQLALEFDATLNEFNHGLYELKRSPGGSIFASIIWLGKLDALNFIKDMRRIYKQVQDIPQENKQKYERRKSLQYLFQELQNMK